MLFTYLLALLFSAFIAFYGKKIVETRKRSPTLPNVSRLLNQLQHTIKWNDQMTESDIEQLIAIALKKYFPAVQRQFLISREKNKRERIDIDLGNGQFGIEVKLAKWLSKTNERNRLLGQIDLYQTRQYHQQNLVVIIAGNPQKQEDFALQEIKAILEKKGVTYFYLCLETTPNYETITTLPSPKNTSTLE